MAAPSSLSCASTPAFSLPANMLRDVALKGSRVLVRADLNVPIDANGTITDDNRIRQFLPTLQLILEMGGSAVVMSHLNDPKEGSTSDSLAPVAKSLSALLGRPVPLAPDCIGSEVEAMANNLKPGEVILLENLRFHGGEKKNDPHFAEQLARLGDVFVSDAFATAHRAHASMVAVPRVFRSRGQPCVAGLLMQRELDSFARALVAPERPLCVVLGGAKVSSKLKVLVNIAERADSLVIGGAMANTFLAALGHEVGRSLYEPDLGETARDLMNKLDKRGCKVYLPVDVVVASSLSAPASARTVAIREIPSDLMAVDVGPATRLLFAEAVSSAATILWNGPMGAFEEEQFAGGTRSMVESIAGAHGFSVVGGGDTDSAIHHSGLTDKFGYISTGGGAFLALLEGEVLPGIQVLQ